ncbi:MAG: hypothetical protein WCG06_03860, partial [Candidatus Omnitrophota bacterium]
TRFGFPSMPDYIHYSSAIMESGQIRVLAGFHAHNLFLHYAVEMGVLGFCLMVVFYALSMRLAWCVWRLRSRLGVVEQGVAVAGAAILWGSLAQSFFEAVTLFYEFTIAIPVAMILAAVVHCTQNTRTGRSR